MIRRYFLAIALIMLSVMAGSISAGDAGQETPFLLGAGARAAGMGGGFSALAKDATAVYYNPALLSDMEYQEAAFMHTILFESSTYDFVSWAFPFVGDYGLGVGYMRLGTGEIIRRVNFAERGDFDYAHSQFLLSFGRRVGGLVAGGLSLKIVNQQMAGESDFGIGLDIGLSATVWENLSLGFVARDVLQPELELGATSEKTPMSATAGVAITELSISDQVALTISGDIVKFENRDPLFQTGAEVSFHGVLSLRGGYNRDNFVLGLGIKHRRLNINYAYKLNEYVSDLHQFSLSILVGSSMTEQAKRRQMALLPPEPTVEEKQFMVASDLANSFFHSFQLDSAAYYYRQALKLQPDNPEVIGTIAAVERMRLIQTEQEEKLRQMENELSQTLLSFLSQAELLYSQGAFQAALDLLELIFDIDPQNRKAGRLKIIIRDGMTAGIADGLDLARKAASEGRLAEAVEACHRVQEIDPDNAEAATIRQQALATMGLQEKVQLGVELFNRGHLDEAAVQFKEVLNVSPGEPTAKEYLSKIETAEFKGATLEDLQKDREIWQLYIEGLRQMRNKEYRAAIESWQKVLKVFPDNPSTISNIEQALLRLESGQPDN